MIGWLNLIIQLIFQSNHSRLHYSTPRLTSLFSNLTYEHILWNKKINKLMFGKQNVLLTTAEKQQKLERTGLEFVQMV